MFVLILAFAWMCVFAILTANNAQKEKDRREELQFYVDISKVGRGKR